MPHPIPFHSRGVVAQGCPALVSTCSATRRKLANASHLAMTAAVAAAVPAVQGGSQALDPRRLVGSALVVPRLLAQIIRRADMSLSVVCPPERRPANNCSAIGHPHCALAYRPRCPTGERNRPLPATARNSSSSSRVLRDAWGQEDLRGRLDTKGRSPLTVKKARTLQASPTDSLIQVRLDAQTLLSFVIPAPR